MKMQGATTKNNVFLSLYGLLSSGYHSLSVSFLTSLKSNLCTAVATHNTIYKKQSRYRPGVARGFQEVKVPAFLDNGTGR